MERKIKKVPNVGDDLAAVTTLASAVNSYARKEYLEFPMGTMIAIVAALIYFVSPVDIIPDVIPVVGYIDDLMVIKVCLSLVNSDLEDYKAWRASVGK